ncbi:MAG: FtsW/RodA/SpoVE family cell cycle protein, partial [Elusimicrobia bacterium]|nr:FtsW/RodA/SpoVE family cell cycle protein [Elusimicrobiota bacterium]
GWFGAGAGASKMKLMHLPAPHTDFIFAIMSEELGLIRITVVIALFCFVLARGIKIAKNADTLSNSMLALGITATIVLQAFFNMAMSLGIVPTKGLPLPFFSYGGSSVMATLIMMGILLNISSEKTRGVR